MVDISLNLDRHWCDDFIYEVVLAPIVDVLESKERCIEIVGDFINAAYGDAVAGALCEMQNEVKESILKVYFNHDYYLSSDSKGEIVEDEDLSNVEEVGGVQNMADNEEEQEDREWREKKQRKKMFVTLAWVTFRDGVSNGDLTVFRQLKENEYWWLAEASSDTLFNLGGLISQVFYYLRNV